jgi:hypothetical protein
VGSEKDGTEELVVVVVVVVVEGTKDDENEKGIEEEGVKLWENWVVVPN